MQENVHWMEMRKGSVEAFEKLYTNYYQFLFAEGFRFCGNKDQVKDIMHEMLLEIWTKRESLPAVTHVGAYLKTYIRRKISISLKQHSNSSASLDDQQLDSELSYEELLVKLEEATALKERIRQAMIALSPAQRKAIEMKFFDGMSYDEMAEATNTSSRTVYNQVYEALKTMRKILRFIFLA